MRINRNDSTNGAENKAPQVQPAASIPQSDPEPAHKDKKEKVHKKKHAADTRKKREQEEPGEEEHAGRRFPFGCLVVLIILALVAFGGYKVMQFYGEIDGKTSLGEEQTVTIEQGSSVGAIATQLKDAGIIEYDWLFKEYAKYSGKAEGIQYGEFTLRSGMDYNSIIQTISQQVRRPTANVTIPEGTTAVGVAQIFVDAGLVDSVDTFLNCANGTDGSDFSQYSFWTQIPDNGRLMKCEGYLFPETYNVYADEDVYYYVDTLYSEFDKKTAGLADTINAKGTTIDDVVKLASFIQ